jgi:hypothetical protein
MFSPAKHQQLDFIKAGALVKKTNHTKKTINPSPVCASEVVFAEVFERLLTLKRFLCL